jgi:hypothetical protein
VPAVTAYPTFKPGDRVQIQDRDRDPAKYEYATVVAVEDRSGPIPDRGVAWSEKPGYVIRYDGNGCEVWVREWDVLAPR